MAYYYIIPGIYWNENSEILVSAIKEAYSLGLYKKLGISVYDPDEVKEFLEIINFDFIQAPVNIFGSRFCDPNLLKFCVKKI